MIWLIIDRKGRSCLTNLLQYFEVITATIHTNSIQLKNVYLDIKKTLDEVYYPIWTDKLNNHGMSSKMS